jgi:hypothetical protein
MGERRVSWRVAVCATALVIVGLTGAAQTLLDQIVAKFNGEIVTQLDIRQARLLKLLDVPNETDQAYLDALVNRRLILADLRRAPGPEPSNDILEARRRGWESRMGVSNAAALSSLLAGAGMTDAGLAGWLRDDVRIQSYLSERFAGRPADLAGWLEVLRQRAGIR